MLNFVPRDTLSIVHHHHLLQPQRLFLSQAPHQDLHQQGSQYCLQQQLFSHRQELHRDLQLQRALHLGQRQGQAGHQGPEARQVQGPHQLGETQSALVPFANMQV